MLSTMSFEVFAPVLLNPAVSLMVEIIEAVNPTHACQRWAAIHWGKNGNYPVAYVLSVRVAGAEKWKLFKVSVVCNPLFQVEPFGCDDGPKTGQLGDSEMGGR